MSLVILLRCAVSLLRCAALTVLLSRTVSLVLLLSRATLTAVEVLHLTGHVMQSRHVTGHPVEVPHSADRAVEVLCLLALLVEAHHLTDHPVEMRGLTVEMRHVAEHLADFAVKQGSSCLYSLGTASMYCFFLFAFTRQLESPFTCHQIVSNGSLQATRVQSSAAATPNGRVRIGEDEGVPERKAYTQSLQ